MARLALSAALRLRPSLPALGIKRRSPNSAEAALGTADALAWNNNWSRAYPLYRKARVLFEGKGDHGRALYAEVSQIPVTMESRVLGTLISELNDGLKSENARAPEVRLRVLEMKARCE